MEVSTLYNTVVLVFALSPEEEMHNKPIPKGTPLFEQLTAHTLKIVQKTGFPYIHVNEQAQSGITFGERFTNSIQKAFDQGYDQVITIGNDTPELSAAHILEAHHRLKANQLVLGPSTDGGFYLMGLCRSHFDRAKFEALPWQTAVLTNALLALVSALNLKTYKLPVLFDIDCTADLKRCIAAMDRIPEIILQLVFYLLQGAKGTELFVASKNYSFVRKGASHNRGSPVLF